MSIASWVFRHSSRAGKYTETLPSSDYTFYPLAGNNDNMGVIAVKHKEIFTQGEDQFWEASISQISGKYEREFLRNAARNAYILNESDKLYKTLFNSISHELRIPVATIMGASDTLIAQNYPEETKIKLYAEISTASVRLNRLIENFLNMSRLESGRITPNPDWCDVNDLANSVSANLKQELSTFNLIVVIPNEMPLIFIDFGLIEQALHNLVLNATQNAQAGTNIRLKFFYDSGSLTIQVMDRGIGFPEKELSSVFNKFYRGKDAKAGGTGLGLSIVKGFIEAHKGTVIAGNRQNGGAIFTIKIPVKISNISHISE
jgi:two-component system sensor histidine kinase KdpD